MRSNPALAPAIGQTVQGGTNISSYAVHLVTTRACAGDKGLHAVHKFRRNRRQSLEGIRFTPATNIKSAFR